MDRQNGFFRQGIPGFSDENADTATPRDRIDKSLRDRIFAEEDGVFRQDPVPSGQADIPASLRHPAPAVSRRHLLRQIQNYSIALAQATLRLDTYPGDPYVLRHYNRCRSLLTETLRMYEARYGKLSTSFPDRR